MTPAVLDQVADILDTIDRLRHAMFFSQDGGEIEYCERRIAEEEAALSALRAARNEG